MQHFPENFNIYGMQHREPVVFELYKQKKLTENSEIAVSKSIVDIP